MDDATARQLHDHPRTETTPWGLLLLLMALTAIGPTTLNIVVPALPAMANRLATDVATIQLTVSVYLLALAAGQLLMGPLSDRFGRRPVVLAGLALTAGASVLAIVISTVESLIFARVLQALGASAGIVVSRAIIRDLFDRNRAAAMIGLVATVMVVVPTLGPLIGGLLDTGFGWESIFIFTAVEQRAGGRLGLVCVAGNPRAERAARRAAGFPARSCVSLTRSAKFAGYVCAGAFGSSTFFAFLGGGPHVVVTLMERSLGGIRRVVRALVDRLHGRQLRCVAAVDAVRHRPADLVGHRIRDRRRRACRPRFRSFAMHWGPIIVFLPQLVISFGNGLLLPGAISGAVSVRPQAAGTAAGITGFAQMALGAAITQYAGALLARVADRQSRSRC